MYPSQITICHWAGPFVNEMKTRAMKRALRFSVATRERRWTQTITQWHNQLRGNSWCGGDEMEKGSCRRAQLSHTAKPLFTQSDTPPKSMWCFSSAKSINAFIWTHKQSCPSVLWLNEKGLSERLWRIKALEPELKPIQIHLVLLTVKLHSLSWSLSLVCPEEKVKLVRIHTVRQLIWV